jgi:major membrane immunogen (membrane-anchored lipoprotein)
LFKVKLMATIALGTALLVLGGCAASQTTQAPASKYQDGIYFAQADTFADSGWKYVVTLEVKDGKISSVDWNGANKAGGADKDTLSASGKYGLVAKGGAQAEWHEQAKKAEAYLIQTQDPTKIEYKDTEGHTDVIAGASISVGEFFELAEKALANGPVSKGKYQDGAYYAEEDAYAKDWKYTASLTVINGNIVAADWNGVNINGGKDKDTLSKDGEYGLKEKGGAQAEWHEQAQKAEAYLLENQDPTKVTYKDDAGHTDAITGASISVKGFFEIAKKALDNGPIAEGPYKDGFYYAQGKEFEKSFKSMAHVAVKNGKIVAVDFNAIAEKKGDPDKDNYSKSGGYGLKAKAGAQAEWHEQVAKAEAYLIQNQDPTKITYKDDAGHTDVIAGASISVGEFFTLAEEALKKAK